MFFDENVINGAFHAAEITFLRLNSRNSHNSLLSFVFSLISAPEFLPFIRQFTPKIHQLLLIHLPIINSYVISKLSSVILSLREQFPPEFQSSLLQTMGISPFFPLSPNTKSQIVHFFTTLPSSPPANMKKFITLLGQVVSGRNTEASLLDLDFSQT